MLDLKHISRYVHGACVQHWEQVGLPYDPPTALANTLEKIVGYLRGTRQPDASFTDFECTLAHDAAQVFGWPPELRLRKSYWGDL